MKKKRVRGSMFDPFKDQIAIWCQQGMTVRKMCEKLGGYYNIATLDNFIVKHNLRTKPTVQYRPKCDECEYCKSVKNIMGTYDKSNRLCTKTWRMIQVSVTYSPTWCEKGAK